ncbi:MAG: T9SS type A sorting domain-containing protein, partial [Flavobacteriaceae bacterium]|nr:T9SS type A sorting domain-containing protein [Flavobacteriaceae bacterium]
YNELGQVFQTHVYGTTTDKISIPFNYKKGLYLINLESDQKVTTYKILKH